MNEFSLIETFFKSISSDRADVLLGVGDDAACLQVPSGMHLLVSTDTLVSGVHFFQQALPYDIAYKSAMVNISDIAAMGGEPAWLSLALTLPALDQSWLTSFSAGLRAALAPYNIALIGGDTTRGPLSITMTIHGFVPQDKVLKRSGARVSDMIAVSGPLGAAALAVALYDTLDERQEDDKALLSTLLYPTPRIDWVPYLRQYASAAIDISDGLCADIAHICQASQVGACLSLPSIPIHDIVKRRDPSNAMNYALTGGEDYELCFTLPKDLFQECTSELQASGMFVLPIGEIEEDSGLRAKDSSGNIVVLPPTGYKHF